MNKLFSTLLIGIVFSFGAVAQELKIESYKVPFHVGETLMVCGNVAQVSKGKKASYLNLDNRYPNQSLSVLIWNSNLNNFEQRFGDLRNFNSQRVCVRGKVIEYKNHLQMHISNPQFLRLMK